MSYIGSWKIDDLLTFVVNTQVFATGVATDADAVPAYRIYEDETTTPLLTGTMSLLDSANTAGYYSEQITLSAANGFEKGKCYCIHIAATVSGVAGATHKVFQIEAEVDANRINWANIDNPTTAQNLSATNIDVDQVVASVSGAVGSVTGAVGSVTGAIGSVAAGGITASSIATNAIDADALATDAVTEIQAGLATAAALATVQSDTDNIQTRLPTALIGGRMDANVGAINAVAVAGTGVLGDEWGP